MWQRCTGNLQTSSAFTSSFAHTARRLVLSEFSTRAFFVINARRLQDSKTAANRLWQALTLRLRFP